MALGDAYATKQEYRDTVVNTDTTVPSTDAIIERQLKAVSRLLEIECETHWNVDAAVVTWSQLGNGSAYLDLPAPGLATATGLEIKIDSDDDASFDDETALVNSTLLLYPLDAAFGQQAKPFTRIGLTSLSAYTVFSSGRLIRIIGKRGWPAVPDMIKELTIELCAIWREESTRATSRMNELDQVVSMNPIAQNLVKRAKNAYSRYGGIAIG